MASPLATRIRDKMLMDMISKDVNEYLGGNVGPYSSGYGRGMLGQKYTDHPYGRINSPFLPSPPTLGPEPPPDTLRQLLKKPIDVSDYTLKELLRDPIDISDYSVGELMGGM